MDLFSGKQAGAGFSFQCYFLSCLTPFRRNMSSELDDKKMKQYANRRAIMDFGMGVFWAGLGTFFMFSKRFGYDLHFLPSPYIYMFGGICLLYGGFRIYRGYKKNYFN